MKILISFLLILSLVGCSDDSGFDTGVGLRIVNQSSVDFDNVLVSSGGAGQNFGPLKSGRTSEYLNYESIYRYGYILIDAGDKQYVLQPIDYVGEKKYEKGDFSYLVNINNPDDQWSVSLEFRED